MLAKLTFSWKVRSATSNGWVAEYSRLPCGGGVQPNRNVDARNSVPAPKRVKENVLDNICNLPIASSYLIVTLSLLISALSNLGVLVESGWSQPFYHRHNVCTNDQKEEGLGRLGLQNHRWGGLVFVLLLQWVLR